MVELGGMTPVASGANVLGHNEVLDFSSLGAGTVTVPYINKLNSGDFINFATFTTATPIEGFPIGGFAARAIAFDVATIELGEWADETSAQRGYCGFEFLAADGLHYGWIDIGIGADVTSLTIYGYAFEDVAGAEIFAGQTTGGFVVPSPPPFSSWAAASWAWASWAGGGGGAGVKTPILEKKPGRAAKFRPCLLLSPRPHLPRTNLAEKLFRTNDHFLADTTKNENVGSHPRLSMGRRGRLPSTFINKSRARRKAILSS